MVAAGFLFERAATRSLNKWEHRTPAMSRPGSALQMLNVALERTAEHAPEHAAQLGREMLGMARDDGMMRCATVVWAP